MHRIVHNAQTDTYRIEKRSFFGWNFVAEQDTGNYLQFDDLQSAQQWLANACTTGRNQAARRWRVVTACHA